MLGLVQEVISIQSFPGLQTQMLNGWSGSCVTGLAGNPQGVVGSWQTGASMLCGAFKPFVFTVALSKRKHIWLVGCNCHFYQGGQSSATKMKKF